MSACCSGGKRQPTASKSIALVNVQVPPASELLPAGNDRPFAEIETLHRAVKTLGWMDEPDWAMARQTLKGEVPITGTPVPGAEEFEKYWVQLLKSWAVPGSAVAVAKDGRVIYSRGFGYADLNTRTKMPADALFRIASISKAMTAVAVLKLVEQGKLKLDHKVMPLLKVKLPADKHIDPELSKVTVANLLDCTAGWDRKISGDPMFQPTAREAAEQCSYTLRPTRDAIERYWLQRKLDFIPGTHFAYSNFSYALLGNIIESVSGQKYEEFMQKEVFAPCGITDARPGRTLELAAGETTYYPFPGQEENASLFPNFRGRVPLPYGSDFALEAMTADTGWLASAPDLVRFISAVAGDGGSKPLVSKASLDKMLSKPNVPEWEKKKVYFAMGWEADTNVPNQTRFSRQGSLPGVITFVCHRPDGISYAFCFNSRPRVSNKMQSQAVGLLEMEISQRKFIH